MHPLTYLHLQMQLEGKALIGDRLKREARAAPDGDLPLLLIAQLKTQEVVSYYNESLSADLHRKLVGSIREMSFSDLEGVLSILKSYDIQASLGHSLTYLFPTDRRDSINGDVFRCSKGDRRLGELVIGGAGEYVFAAEQDGRIISACCSARENEFCGEAWVFTDPAYQNRGLTGKVLNAWAASLVTARKIPFYSEKTANPASARLAADLGLEPIFEEIEIRQISE
jgi:hypothetical protein